MPNSQVAPISPKSLHELPLYPYENLLAADNLRILKVQQADPGSVLICELSEHEDARNIKHNAEDPEAPVGYEALSWCWGKHNAPEEPLFILDKGASYKLMVRTGLHAALVALRQLNASRYLWVDCVCINQENISERNHQVARMNKIYGDAFNVCIWLGAADPNSTLAFSFIKDNLTKAYLFDQHIQKRVHIANWVALIWLIKRPWFSRRWIVQEVALAQNATVHCGDDSVAWEQLCSAVSLMIEPDGVLSKLSSHARTEESLGYQDAFFDEVPNLCAARLVDITSRFFKRHAGNKLEPTNKLEDIMAWLPRFENGEPRDIVYALLALAKDTQAAVVNQMPNFLYGKRVTEKQKKILRKIAKSLPQFHRESYTVNYELEVVDVYQQFVSFVISRADPSRSRALDIICRPFAQDFDVNGNLIKLPSWIPSIDKLPFVKNEVAHYMHPSEETSRFSMDREGGDLFVSTPDSKSYYSAAGRRGYDIDKVRFRKRPDHFSMFVEGFVLDIVNVVKDTSQDGYIDKSWLELHRDRRDGPASDSFWRTLVADRGPRGTTPAFYRRTLLEILNEPRQGSIATQKLIRERSSSQVSEVMKHIVATISRRKMIETAEYKLLGLVPNDTQKGDLVCIIFGCSVPVILRQADKKDLAQEEAHDDAEYHPGKEATLERLRDWRRRRAALRQTVPNPFPYQKDHKPAKSFWNSYMQMPFSWADASLLARLTLVCIIALASLEFGEPLAGFLLALVAAPVITLRAERVHRHTKSLLILIYTTYLGYICKTQAHSEALVSATLLSGVAFMFAPELLPRHFWIYVLPAFITNRPSGKNKPLIETKPDPKDDLGTDPKDPRRLAHDYSYKLIGESYIDTMMSGEAIKLQNESVQSEHRIRTVIFELR